MLTGRGKIFEEQAETHWLVKHQDSLRLSSDSSRENTADQPNIPICSLFQPTLRP